MNRINFTNKFFFAPGAGFAFTHIFFVLVFLIHFTLACGSGQQKKGIHEFSLLTYNLKGWQRKKGKPGATLNFLKSVNYDIIVLQEFTPYFKKKLKPILKEYRYQRLLARKGAYGYALYSKYPIKKTRYLAGARRGYAAQCVYIQKIKSNICNVHLKSAASAVKFKWSVFKDYSKNVRIRTKEWGRVLKFCFKKRNCIIAGDMNTVETEKLYTTMTKNLIDVVQDQDLLPANTFPNPAISMVPMAVVRIDYIFVTKTFTIKDAKTIKTGGSDHYPISVRLSLP